MTTRKTLLNILTPQTMNSYRVSVTVMTPYHTDVEAENEEQAIAIALEREAPNDVPINEAIGEDEWVPSGLLEFPNLRPDETPYVEALPA